MIDVREKSIIQADIIEVIKNHIFFQFLLMK